MATKAQFSKFHKYNSASLWIMPLGQTLPNLALFERGEVSQTGTPRTIVFYGRHILDGSMGENTCAPECLQSVHRVWRHSADTQRAISKHSTGNRQTHSVNTSRTLGGTWDWWCNAWMLQPRRGKERSIRPRKKYCLSPVANRKNF